MNVSSVINAFTAGELSPRLAGRDDLQQYYQSAEEILNMIVEFYGGAKKAPGTYFSKEVKHSDKITRNYSFIFSDTQAYMLEIGDQYIRFYKDDGQIVHTLSSVDAWAGATAYAIGDFVKESSTIYYCIVAHTSGTFATDLAAGKWVAQSIYEIPTDYLEADIRSLQFSQKEDVLYITHPDYPQAELTRSGHTAWTLSDIDYSVHPARPALMDLNITDTTITLSGSVNNINVSSSTSGIFEQTHIGSIWKITSAKSVSAAAWAASTGYVVNNYVEYNDVIYFCISNHTSGNSFSVDHDAGKWSRQDIYIKLNSVASSSLAIADVLYSDQVEASPPATKNWQEGSWSAKRGYPRGNTLFEDRLIYAYTSHQPQTTWESETGAHKTFNRGTDDDDASAHKANTNQVETIQWVFPSNEIMIGTVSGIHVLGTGNDTTAFTPTTVRIKKKSRVGASQILPKQIGNYVYYWQEYNKKLREYAYSLDDDDYSANDATAFADHISGDGIIDMAYQQSPYSILWCVREDGKLASFTRQIEQKVAGWALHDTDGKYKSVAVIPKTNYDEVWFIVERTIGGVTKKYMEYQADPEFDEQEDMFFVHSGLSLDVPIDISGATATNPVVITANSHGISNATIVKIRGITGMTELNGKKFKATSVSTNTITLTDTDDNAIDGSSYTAYEEGGEVRECVNSVSGLDHLEGKTVQVCADGSSHPDRVVSSGAISLDTYYGEVHVGLGYTARLTTNDYEPNPQSVHAQGHMKRISGMSIRFYKTLGCRYGRDTSHMEVLTFRDSSMTPGMMIPLFTGIKQVPFNSGWGSSRKVVLEQTQPLSMHILSIMLEGEVN